MLTATAVIEVISEALKAFNALDPDQRKEIVGMWIADAKANREFFRPVSEWFASLGK